MHGLRTQAFSESRGVREITEEHSDQLALALDGATRGEDLVGEVFWRIGVWLGVIDGRRFFGLLQIMTAFVTEPGRRWQSLVALRAFDLEFLSTAEAEIRIFTVVESAFLTFHFGSPPPGKMHIAPQ